MSTALSAGKIARRYVSSLFTDSLSPEEMASVSRDLNDMAAMMAASSELRHVVASPLYGRNEQADAMAALAEKAKFSPLTAAFLSLLADNRRLHLLPYIVREADTYLARRSGVIGASIVTARKLTAADQKKIQSAIKTATGMEPALQADVDESLLGGMTVQIGSVLIDGSLKSKLDRLERTLAGGQKAA